MFVEKLAAYRKAIAAFITPGIVVVIASLASASDGGSVITVSEWLYVALAVLGTGSVVAAVPNALTARQKLDIAVGEVELPALPTEVLVPREGDADKIANPDLYPVADVQAARARAGLPAA